MKKTTTLLIIVLTIYLAGLFCYKLGRPLDAATSNMIYGSVLQEKNASSSIKLMDYKSRQEINDLVAGEVMPGSKLYGMKIFGEKLRLYFSKTEKETERLRVMYLNRRLAEAEVLLETGQTGEAQQMVNRFAKGSEELMLELKKQDFLRSDPSRATDIEKAITDQIDLQKSMMLGIGTSSPLFPIKERLLTLELNMADTPVEKSAVLQEQEKDKLVRIAANEKIGKKPTVSDWQIIKNEAKIFYGQINNYIGLNTQKVEQLFGYVKSKTLELVDKVRK
jgi:hypothetical protein